MGADVFNDQNLDNQIHEWGFVKIEFLDDWQLSKLTAIYSDLQNKFGYAPFTTFMSEDIRYKRTVDIAIKNVFEESVKKIFKIHVPFWGNFFTKNSGSPQMPLHADLQYVDENRCISLNIWAPLSATGKTNATLGVVPGSHRLMKQIRGLNITGAYAENAEVIAEKFVYWLDFKPGEAIIYDHRLLHLSSANNSSDPRVAATLVMVPKNEPITMYFAQKEGDTTFYAYCINHIEELLPTEFKKLPVHLTPSLIVEGYQFTPISPVDVEKVTFSINV